jgi:hypothetical protein
MLIARFGPTWAGATVLSSIDASDDWLNSTPPTIAQAGGAGGAFDFAGDKPYPLQPVTISKSLVIASSTWATVELYADVYKRMISYGRDKLWGLCRDGTHRWAWAKCIEVNASEKPKQFHTYPIAMKFYLPEGVWYSENLASITRTTPGYSGFTVLNGSWFAYPTFTMSILSGTMTAFTLREISSLWSFTYTHNITAAQSVVVNSAALSCAQTGVANAYQYLTLPANQFPWMWIVPGGQSFNLSVSGTCTFSATLTHYLTYL